MLAYLNFINPLEINESTWDKIIGTNLKGTFFASREAAKYMKISGKGSIVNISSTRALMSEPNSEAYAASKGGISGLDSCSCFLFVRIQYNC
jgi:NAD(P)-dependent dehydrogenase (short-subunit alcohol dehydrogenase family)